VFCRPKATISRRSGGTFHCSVNLPGVVDAFSPDQIEPREAAAYLVENQTRLVAVSKHGGVGNDPHRQPSL
jgi:hypothetical protein